MNLSSRRFATLALAAMLLVTSPAALHAPAHADPRDDAAAAQGTSGSESEAPDDGSPDIGAPGKDAPIKDASNSDAPGRDASDIEVEAAAPRFTDPDEGSALHRRREGMAWLRELAGETAGQLQGFLRQVSRPASPVS